MGLSVCVCVSHLFVESNSLSLSESLDECPLQACEGGMKMDHFCSVVITCCVMGPQRLLAEKISTKYDCDTATSFPSDGETMDVFNVAQCGLEP